MNKRTRLIVLGLLLMACTACQFSPTSIVASGTTPIAPSSIPDPILKQAWFYLYNQEEPFQLWTGASLTGRNLAQFILDHQIPIVWDSDGVCGGASCSLVQCTTEGCVSTDSDPIYILPSKRDDLMALVGIIAHEIFHRQEPFGEVHASRYEEYWAYAVGVHFSKDERIEFDGYDPLVPAQLVQWFKNNRIHDYYGLQYYPPGLGALAQEGQKGANMVERLTQP